MNIEETDLESQYAEARAKREKAEAETAAANARIADLEQRQRRMTETLEQVTADLTAKRARAERYRAALDERGRILHGAQAVV